TRPSGRLRGKCGIDENFNFVVLEERYQLFSKRLGGIFGGNAILALLDLVGGNEVSSAFDEMVGRLQAGKLVGADGVARLSVKADGELGEKRGSRRGKKPGGRHVTLGGLVNVVAKGVSAIALTHDFFELG